MGEPEARRRSLPVIGQPGRSECQSDSLGPGWSLRRRRRHAPLAPSAYADLTPGVPPGSASWL